MRSSDASWHSTCIEHSSSLPEGQNGCAAVSRQVSSTSWRGTFRSGKHDRRSPLSRGGRRVMWAGIEGHLPSRSCQTSGVSALPERGEKRAWRLTTCSITTAVTILLVSSVPPRASMHQSIRRQARVKNEGCSGLNEFQMEMKIPHRDPPQAKRDGKNNEIIRLTA